MKKLLTSLLVAGLCLTQGAWAYGPGYYGNEGYPGWRQGPEQYPGYHGMPQRPVEQGPRELLTATIEKMRAFMAESESSDEMKMAVFLETEITPLFDFAYMTQWAAGRHFDEMSDSDKAGMEGEIKRLFLSALAKGLGGSYADSRLYVTHARPVSEKEVQVGLRVVRRDGPPVKMKFRFYLGDRGWKIFDVIAFNSSAVMYFRNHFAKSFKQN